MEASAVGEAIAPQVATEISSSPSSRAAVKDPKAKGKKGTEKKAKDVVEENLSDVGNKVEAAQTTGTDAPIRSASWKARHILQANRERKERNAQKKEVKIAAKAEQKKGNDAPVEKKSKTDDDFSGSEGEKPRSTTPPLVDQSTPPANPPTTPPPANPAAITPPPEKLPADPTPVTPQQANPEPTTPAKADLEKGKGAVTPPVGTKAIVKGHDWLGTAFKLGAIVAIIITAFGALCLANVFPQAFLGGQIGCIVAVSIGGIATIGSGLGIWWRW